MDTNDQNKVIAFDTLFSSNHIQMLKVLLPCLDRQVQKSLAIYIKFMELRYTILFFQKHSHPLNGCTGKEAPPDFGNLCNELLPYCTNYEKKQLEQMKSMLQNLDTYKEMAQAMDLMKDFMPDMNMLTPEQKQIFDIIGGNTYHE